MQKKKLRIFLLDLVEYDTNLLPTPKIRSPRTYMIVLAYVKICGTLAAFLDPLKVRVKEK